MWLVNHSQKFKLQPRDKVSQAENAIQDQDATEGADSQADKNFTQRSQRTSQAPAASYVQAHQRAQDCRKQECK